MAEEKSNSLMDFVDSAIQRKASAMEKSMQEEINEYVQKYKNKKESEFTTMRIVTMHNMQMASALCLSIEKDLLPLALPAATFGIGFHLHELQTYTRNDCKKCRERYDIYKEPISKNIIGESDLFLALESDNPKKSLEDLLNNYWNHFGFSIDVTPMKTDIFSNKNYSCMSPSDYIGHSCDHFGAGKIPLEVNNSNNQGVDQSVNNLPPEDNVA